MSSFSKNFIDPPKEFSAVPFWFLNDGMEPERLKKQLQEMYEKGIYECIVHARKGMEIEYLSENWFHRIGVILEEAQRLSMKIWIYDEDNWPSGYAGGRVIQRDPDFAATCLSMEKIIPVTGKPLEIPEITGKEIVSVVAVWHNEKFFDITEYESKKCNQWVSPGIQWEVFVLRSEKCTHSPAYSNKPYVDLLNPNAVSTFIELTHLEYKQRFPQYWGSTIKGFFTDEPGFYQNYVYQTANLNTIPWTRDFPVFFKEQRGYDLMPYIGALWDEMGEISRKIRFDYYRTFTQLYNMSFFKQVHDFCEKDGLSSIGHLHMEEHLSDTVQMEGHFFEDMKYLHIPGIDRIDRERNRITEKLGSSAAHIHGKKRCFSETYGCFGWGLTLNEMKAEADWQYVRGINMLVLHAFFGSIQGIRQSESPPSLFYQNPYWEYFSIYANYIRRLSFAMSEGKNCSEILLYYPIVSCWEQFKPLSHYSVDKLDEKFIEMSQLLLCNQLDFDYIDDSTLAERFSIKDGQFINENTQYKSIILPPITSLPVETLRVLRKFVNGGGIIISTCEAQPKAALPENDEEAEKLWRDIVGSQNYCNSKVSELPDICRSFSLGDLILEVPDPNIKYIHRKAVEHDLYFITNESHSDVMNTCSVPGFGKATVFDPETGFSEDLHTFKKMDRVYFQLCIRAQGSILINFSEKTKLLELSDWEISLPDGIKQTNKLKDWCDYGFPEYSGSMTYKTEFELNDASIVKLDMGEVRDIAEVLINGVKVAVRCWQPFILDVSKYVIIGRNTLQIKVTNTLANALTDIKSPSGLIGPVLIEQTNES